MYHIDAKGGRWTIDEGLRKRADDLIREEHDLLGHIELDKVIFARVSGVKCNWLGKCFYIERNPLPLIGKYVAYKLKHLGLLSLDNTSIDLEGFDLFDLRYIIILNDDLMETTPLEISAEKFESCILLHEMMHISEDMRGVVKHDIEDFRSLVAKFGPYWSAGVFKDSDGETVSVSESN